MPLNSPLRAFDLIVIAFSAEMNMSQTKQLTTELFYVHKVFNFWQIATFPIDTFLTEFQ